jgi:hypothetical protein
VEWEWAGGGGWDGMGWTPKKVLGGVGMGWGWGMGWDGPQKCSMTIYIQYLSISSKEGRGGGPAEITPRVCENHTFKSPLWSVDLGSIPRRAVIRTNVS